MNSMKKRLLSAICAALLVLSTAACGGGNNDNASDGASADTANAAPAAMSKEDYLAAVDGLNSAAEDFTVATAEFIASGLSGAAEDEGALDTAIEKIRETKQPFIAFSEITTPAEGYAEAHADLAKNCGDFASLIDEYCDVLLKTLAGGDAGDTDDLQARMETVVNALGESVTAVQAIQ